MLVAGIESSCDETSIGIVEDGWRIRGHVIVSQAKLHEHYGGVVPELASRKHVQAILPAWHAALQQASCKASDLQGIAVTNRPGLSGSLLVGLTFAKTLAWASGLPWVSVDHIHGHISAADLQSGNVPQPEMPYPRLCLLASGGHSMVCRVDDPLSFTVLGASIDDAAGEALDKLAKHLGLGYPGGPCLEALARGGDPTAYEFPMPNLYKSGRRYDFSFSGIKTAAIHHTLRYRKIPSVSPEQDRQDLAASYQRVVFRTLLRSLRRAVDDLDIHRVVIAGGVAANSELRRQLAEWEDLQTLIPAPELCTDNGAMIAAAGYHLLLRGDRSALDEGVSPRVSGHRLIDSAAGG